MDVGKIWAMNPAIKWREGTELPGGDTMQMTTVIGARKKIEQEYEILPFTAITGAAHKERVTQVADWVDKCFDNGFITP